MGEDQELVNVEIDGVPFDGICAPTFSVREDEQEKLSFEKEGDHVRGKE